MRGHGSVDHGNSLRDAVFTTYYLRLNAEVLIKAMSTGGTITYLSPGEIEQSGELHSQALAQGAHGKNGVRRPGLQP